MTPFIKKYLNQTLAEKFNLSNSTIVFHTTGGGCINETFKISVDKYQFFLKINSATEFPGLFEGEKNGLDLLAEQKLIRVPQPFIHDEIDSHQLLVLEWIETGLKTDAFWKKFGERLARLHELSWSDGDQQTTDGQTRFGLDDDNYMGSLIQKNTPHSNWVDFFIHCRLEPQVKLAAEKNLLEKKHLTAFQDIYPRLDSIFNKERSSLLHGDLWSGNFMCDENSEPVLIDPAVYYGHRSVDLGMTILFGGFDKKFYDAYNYHYPFPKNYREQWDVANLYPLLIHLNLFGVGYRSRIVEILKKYA
jgi:fructosamine-3-kinase